MARITIDALPEFTGNLATASFVPVMYEGTTYKYSPLTKSVGLTGDQTIAGVKTFSSSPIVPDGDASGEAVNYGQVVKNTGDETIAGVKNFTSTPTVSGTPVITGTTSSTPSAGKVMVWSDVQNATITPASGYFTGLDIGDTTIRAINGLLRVHLLLQFDAKDISISDSVLTLSGITLSKTLRIPIFIDTSTARLTGHIAVFTTGNTGIYFNSGEPITGIVSACRTIYTDVVLEI